MFSIFVRMPPKFGVMTRLKDCPTEKSCLMSLLAMPSEDLIDMEIRTKGRIIPAKQFVKEHAPEVLV